MCFVTCDIEQEEEADWLGGCLLFPRTVLLQAAKQGKTAECQRSSNPAVFLSAVQVIQHPDVQVIPHF
jgi:hypothetical protein